VVEEETTETKETEVSEEEREAEAEVSPELTKARKVADDQRKRAEKAETELKKLKNGGKDRVPNKDGQGISEEDTARITRSEERSERAALRSMGITHADDIEYVRKAATRLGIDVEEAATDEFVKSKLDRMKAARDTKDATPQPNRRSGASRSTKLPDFSKMSNAEFDKWERENRA